MSVRALFPTFIFERDLLRDPTLSPREGVTEEYLLELKEEMDRMRKDDPAGRQVSNAYTGWQGNEPVEASPKFGPLMRKIKTMFDDEVLPFYGIDKGKMQVTMGNCWPNINDFGAWNRPHLHPGCWYSGCFYVHAEGDEGTIEFIDTDSKVVSDYPNSPRGANHHTHSPRSGELILFPSGAMHMVAPNMTNKDRYSVAFNVLHTSLSSEGLPVGEPKDWHPDEFCWNIDKDGRLSKK